MSSSVVETRTQLPRFFRVQQSFARQALEDVRAAVAKSLQATNLRDLIGAGQSVAIAAGSRGIADIDTVVRSVVDYVKEVGGEPFVVPAMGSHGGATAEGQATVLATLGITAESMGCPIKSSMQTTVVGTTENGLPVHFDHNASEADHVIVVNRIKPHTRLTGDFESGLIKMLMIGLGKHIGAQTYHQGFAEHGYRLDRIARDIIPLITQKMPITMGVAIIEDAFDQVAHIHAVTPESLLDEEPQLLQRARDMMPCLPFDHADLLIVDQIGKEISGTGMDTNVVGRKSNDREAGEHEFPKIREIFVRSLTKKTNGNATGIGIAEYCHAGVTRDMNLEMTRINCITSGHPSAGAVPLYFDSDREVLDAAISQARDPDSAKWMWIRDTLHLEVVACSEAYLAAADARDDLHILDEPHALSFDAADNLNAFR